MTDPVFLRYDDAMGMWFRAVVLVDGSLAWNALYAGVRHLTRFDHVVWQGPGLQ